MKEKHIFCYKCDRKIEKNSSYIGYRIYTGAPIPDFIGEIRCICNRCWSVMDDFNLRRLLEERTAPSKATKISVDN